jgi:hypothetical protein
MTGCLSCDYGGIDADTAATCSANTEPAACCRQEGNGCQDLGLDQTTAACAVGGDVVCGAVAGNANAGGSGCDMNAIPTTAHVGRFVAVGRPMSINDAIDYCEAQHASLASIHSWEEQQVGVQSHCHCVHSSISNFAYRVWSLCLPLSLFLSASLCLSQQAATACEAYADATETQSTGYSNAGHGDNRKYGCWIGFQVGA